MTHDHVTSLDPNALLTCLFTVTIFVKNDASMTALLRCC